MALALSREKNKKIIIHSIILLLIAALSYTIYIYLDRGVKRHKESAYIINVSGRQRMLSQFIALSALQYKDTIPEQQQILSSAISEMQQAHDYLTSISSMSEELKEMYFLPLNTDTRVKLYLEIASKVLNNPNQNEHIVTLLNLRLELLASLESIVSQHQKEAQDSVVFQQRLQLSLLLLILALVASEAYFLIFPLYRQLGVYSRLATRDTLSGCHSRGYFLQLLRLEHKRSLRYDGKYSLLILDIDFFKKVNDTYGHPAGDQVIQQIARSIKKEIRKTDQCGRIGGEEFAVLLMDMDANQAMTHAEKLRIAIEHAVTHYDKHEIQVTASIGVIAFDASRGQEEDHGYEVDDLIKRADMAMYSAKQSGRNQTHAWKP